MKKINNPTKMITIKCEGEYKSSNYKKTGTKKEILDYLRVTANDMRKSAGINNTSKLAKLESYHLNGMGVAQLCELMSDFGVLKFSVI